MLLRDLLRHVPNAELRGTGGVEIRRIDYDSRAVEPGSLFVAVPGFRADGHDFIPEAVARGAAAVAVQRDRAEAGPERFLDTSLPTAIVPDSRRALADLAAAFHGFPGERLRVVGVTGTDGKTTTTYLASAVLEAGGYETGLVGTAERKVGRRQEPNPSRFTTPEAPEVQALLAEMVRAGVDYAVVESSSHGLALHRLDHCGYDVAVFTNLSGDHLDFHGSREAYMAAKGRLFEMLDEPTAKQGERFAVVNADDAAAGYMASRSRRARVVTYGIDAPADVRAADVALTADRSAFTVTSPWGTARVDAPFPGRFNVSNLLAALTVGLTQGVPLDRMAEALREARGVPGRMERIDVGQPFAVLVDYAHTGDALRKVLATLRGLAEGRVLVVFGAAGGRDAPRRTGLGQAAAELADYAVLTNEDPRHEDPEAIIDEIARAMQAAGRTEGRDFARVVDRREAIAHALARARPGDVVLIAGKGHEQSIIVGDRALPWDDRQVARELLRDLTGRRGR
ncbi:MAG TPA: UDP-N-acetylmuramoyl-L-alanyl-D-glutamate--2,6-diaminopimelate ligase [Dehalococcoidia bacterium]